MIRIVLVDDHAMLRQALARVLNSQPDMEVVAEAGTVAEALEAVQKARPDIVLMDITMPDGNGISAATRLRDMGLPGAVLMLTIHDRDEYLFKALRAGALGYVLKETDLDELLAAVRTVAQGKVYIQSSMASKLVADYLQRTRAGARDSNSLDILSPREQEILRLIGDGYTTAQIAQELVISQNTVRTHRDRIMEKLGLHNKAALIRYAISHGLTEAVD